MLPWITLNKQNSDFLRCVKYVLSKFHIDPYINVKGQTEVEVRWHVWAYPAVILTKVSPNRSMYACSSGGQCTAGLTMLTTHIHTHIQSPFHSPLSNLFGRYNNCMNTCYYEQNIQFIISMLVSRAWNLLECWSVQLSASYIDLCWPV